MKTKKCKVCGKEFEPRTSLNRYCSYDCSYKIQKKSIKKYQKKVKTKKAVTKLSSLKKKADNIWKSVGKEGAVCEVCKRMPEHKVQYKQLHAHHIVGRKNMTLRWDLRNRIWLCAYHHTLGPISAHNSPRWFMEEFFKVNYPDDYNYLIKHETKITKVTADYVTRCILRMGDEST